MPIHDWPRVQAGVFHHFHHEWIAVLQRKLNTGLLPGGFYALAEQVVGGLGPDVLALEGGGFTLEASPDSQTDPPPDAGGVAVAAAPPQVMFAAEAEPDLLVRRKSRVVVRHSSDHRVVAILENVSPGNKASRHALEAFVQKAYEFIEAGVHLLIIDLLPPGPRDPQGIHAAIWEAFDLQAFTLPEGKPLTLAAYSAGLVPKAWVQPVAVGESLPDMPLFLSPETYIPVPLAETYENAFDGVPRIWREALAAGESKS